MAELAVATLKLGIDDYFYLGTPYSKWVHGLDDANEVAQKLSGRLLLEGIVVFTPIGHSHGIAKASGIDPFDHSIWLPADRPFVMKAFGLIVAALPGWRESFGIGEEIKWFKEQKKPRYLLDPHLLTVRPLP